MKKIVGFLICLGVALVLMVNPSCNYDYLEPVEIIIPDTVSFSENILPIFDDNCAKSGCHVTGSIAPDLTPANAWFELWVYGFVDTTDAQSSILYERISSASDPMPPTGKMTEDKVQLILAWIEQGALNN